MSQSFVHMAKGFYQDEVNDHLTYTALAEKTKDPTLRSDIARIAASNRRGPHGLGPKSRPLRCRDPRFPGIRR